MIPSRPEVLFTWAWYGHGRGGSPPLPPLQAAQVAAWLRRESVVDVASWDPTFHPGHGSFEVAVSRLRPQVCWVHTHPTTRTDALRMVEVARRAGAAVIVGGIDAAFRPEAYLRAGADAVVRGEGEATTLALVLALRSAHHRATPAVIGHIPGLVHLGSDGAPRRTPGQEVPVPPELLPAPWVDPLQARVHLERQKERSLARAYPVASARGCPEPCRSCTHSRLGRSFRRRPPEAVAAELRTLAETLHVERFVFQDELFAWDAAWIRDFARARVAGGLLVPFEATARPVSLDERVARRLLDAGAQRIALDVGPPSEALARKLDWPWRPADVLRAAAILRDQGLPIVLRVPLGLQREEREDRQAAIRLVEAIAPEAVEVERADDLADDPSPRNWDRSWEGEGGGVPSAEVAQVAAQLRRWSVAPQGGSLRQRWFRRLPEAIRSRL